MAKQGVLRSKAAAEYLGISPSWLEKLRRQRQGPRVVRLGKRAIGYTVADLERWVQKRRSATQGSVVKKALAREKRDARALRA